MLRLSKMVYDGEDIGPLYYRDGQEIREGDYGRRSPSQSAVDHHTPNKQ